MKITWTHIIIILAIMLLTITAVSSLAVIKANSKANISTHNKQQAVERYVETAIPAPECIHGEASDGLWQVRHYNNAGVLLLEAKVEAKDIEFNPQWIRVDYGICRRVYFSGGVFQMIQIGKQ